MCNNTHVGIGNGTNIWNTDFVKPDVCIRENSKYDFKYVIVTSNTKHYIDIRSALFSIEFCTSNR